jgi:hypothetical protein
LKLLDEILIKFQTVNQLTIRRLTK